MSKKEFLSAFALEGQTTSITQGKVADRHLGTIKPPTQSAPCNGSKYAATTNHGCADGAPLAKTSRPTRLSDEASRKVAERCARSGCCLSEASSTDSATAKQLFSLGGAAGGAFGSFSCCRRKGTSPAGNEATNIYQITF